MNDASSSRGRELYHEIWRTVATKFYDLRRLNNWAHWQHCYDERITDDNSALRYAQKMLTSLGDRYTRILPIAEQSDSEVAVETDIHVIAKRLKCNIGYLAIKNFSAENIAELTERSLKTIADCEGFILDLSNNLGGSLGRTIECLSLFIEEGPLASLEFRSESGVNVQDFYLVDDACIRDSVSPNGSADLTPFRRRKCLIGNKPVALVIGPDSASCCETFIAALLWNRRNTRRRGKSGDNMRLCWSFGERTSGKGIMQATHDILEGRARLMVSVGVFKSPDGHWFGDAQARRHGIRADFRVKGRKEKACKAAFRHLKIHLSKSAAA